MVPSTDTGTAATATSSSEPCAAGTQSSAKPAPPKRPLLRRPVDAAGAWQQQTRLQQLGAAITALPHSSTLPNTVVTELNKVMALLQRLHNTDDEGNTGCVYQGSIQGSNSSSSSEAGPTMPAAAAALALAAQYIKVNILQQMQPTAAAAACVHAHLFAAWVRGAAARATSQAISNSSNDHHGTVPNNINSSSASTASSTPQQQQQQQQQVGPSASTPEAAPAGLAAHTPAAAAAADIPDQTSWQPAALSPISTWALSSQQYASLVHKLDMLPLLLDHLAWLHPATTTSSSSSSSQCPPQEQDSSLAASSASWQQLQQQQLQLLLLTEAACACPSLAAQLLHLLVHATPQETSSSSSSSSAGSSLHPWVAAVLLALWCRQASPVAAATTAEADIAGAAAAADISSGAERAKCLLSLCSVTQQLLLRVTQAGVQAGQHAQQEQRQEQQQQPQGVTQQHEGVTVPVPAAVLQLLCPTPDGEAAACSTATQQQQQQQQHGCWVLLPDRLLLAVALQLLDDLLCAWGHAWHTPDPATSEGSSSLGAVGVLSSTAASIDSSCSQAAAGDVEQVQVRLSGLQKQLQQLLQQLLSTPQQQQQQQQEELAGQGAAPQHSMLALLPVLTHQLVAHANSRLSLTLMMAAMQGQAGQTHATAADGQTALEYPSAAAAATASGQINAVTWALCEDPFGWQAQQQQLQCPGTCTALCSQQQQQQQAPLQAYSWSAATQQQQQQQQQQQMLPDAGPCWQCCLKLPQGPRQGLLYSSSSHTQLLRTLPCSFVRQAGQQQQQQQRQDLVVQAPAFSIGGFSQTDTQAAGAAAAAHAQHSPADAAAHIMGLLAAWLSPGYSLQGLLLKLPVRTAASAAEGPMQADSNRKTSSSSSSSSSASSRQACGADLVSSLSATAATDYCGVLMVSGSLLSMLLHVTAMQQLNLNHTAYATTAGATSREQPMQQTCMVARVQWQGRALQHLLLAMLCVLMPQIKDPQQQQVLLAALNPAPLQLRQPSPMAVAAPDELGASSDSKAASSTTSSSSSGRMLAEVKSWDWLRQQLSVQHRPALAAAAARALVAASNRLVAAANVQDSSNPAASDGAAGQHAPAAAVVLPQQQQEALLAAEMMQALLLFAALWPGPTVRRLLQDGIMNRSQQPIVVRLLDSLHAALQSPQHQLQASALQPNAHDPLGVHMQPIARPSTLLMQQLLELLLPAPLRVEDTADMQPCQHKQQQQQALELSEAQRQTAVALVLQLVSGGIVSLQVVLLLLCVQPLQLLWQFGWQYVRSAGHLRLLLLLTQELLGMTASSAPATAGSAAAAPAAPAVKAAATVSPTAAGRPAPVALGSKEADTSVGGAGGGAQHNSGLHAAMQACCCPLHCESLPVLELAAPVPATEAAGTGQPAAAQQHPQRRQQQPLPVAAAGNIKAMLLGLCRAQQLLQEVAFAAYRPDYQGTGQAAAILQALVAAAAAAGVSIGFVAAADQDKPGPGTAAAAAATAFTLPEWQQLMWQQRVLLGQLIPAELLGVQDSDPTKDACRVPDSSSIHHTFSSSSSSGGVLATLLQPAGLQVLSASSTTATPAVNMAALVLDCCRFAAVSTTCAEALAQAVLALGSSPTAAARAAAARSAARREAEQTVSISSSCSLAVSISTALATALSGSYSSPQQLKQSTAIALGQFLPWASSSEAARVVLRLVPTLLGLPGAAKQQQLQLQQDTAPSAVSLECWSATVQVVCRAVKLFHLHGTCPSSPAQQPAGPGNAASVTAGAAAEAAAAAAAVGGVGRLSDAKQLAAEQCFRHISLLLVTVMGALPSTNCEVLQPEWTAGTGVAGVSSTSTNQHMGHAHAAAVAGAGDQRNPAETAAAAATAELRLMQLCVKELCGLVAALSAQYDCSGVQAVLLQLLMQLCSLVGQGQAVAVHSTAATWDSRVSSKAPTADPQHPAAAAAADGGLHAADAAGADVAVQVPPAGTRPAWEWVLLPDGTTGSRVLLEWVAAQLQQLPPQLQQLLGPGVVHVTEQHLSLVLGRALESGELDELERIVTGSAQTWEV